MTTIGFLSSVATIKRTVVVGSSPSGQSRDKAAYSITHVFTPPHLRHRGYATAMMSLLHVHLSALVDELHDKHGPAILSFLYSGVGTFYSRCGPPGWHIQSSRETYWKVSDLLSSQSAGVPSGELHPRPSPIREDSFASLAQLDADLLRSEVANHFSPAFAVLTTGDEFSWLVARSKFYGRILSSDRPPPQYWGTVLDEPDEAPSEPAHTIDIARGSTLTYAVWFFDYAKKELHFLRIRCPLDQPWRFEIILREAATAAAEQGCERILAWNVDEKLLDCTAKIEGTITRNRTKNLAAVAWYGEGECPVWLASQKYGWC